MSNESLMSRIRYICQLVGIRQKDLADNLKLKPSQMNLYFRGKVEMRSDRLIPLLKILGIDLEELIENRIRELDGKSLGQGQNSKLLASMGRLDDYKKQSLLRIIHILGSK